MEATLPPKLSLSFNGLYGVVSQKTLLIISSSVRASTPAQMLLFEAETA
jgi:hypothetical protein